jgi:hypothetical protein
LDYIDSLPAMNRALVALGLLERTSAPDCYCATKL